MFEKFKTWYGKRNQPVSLNLRPNLKRRFTAAGVNRLTNDWRADALPTNALLRGDLKTLRNRSRDLCRNNAYANHILRLYRNNVVGEGFTLQLKPDAETDEKVSTLVETAWKEWTKAEFCNTSGRMDFMQICHLAIEALIRDGEFLIRKVYDRDNKYGVSLRVYGCDWLDETYNERLPNGNRIIMSVEVDKMDRPLAYWLTEPMGNYPSRNQDRRRTRYVASDFIHGFLQSESEDQTRGVPHLHASMLRLKTFDRFETAEGLAKAINASQMGFLIPPEDEQYRANMEDDEGNPLELITEVEAGIFAELPPNYDFKSFEPKADSSAPDFKKTALRGAFAGAGISYHTGSGDLESVNFSSGRMGAYAERDNFRLLQKCMISILCEPVYKFWIESAYMLGAVRLTAKEYTMAQKPLFRGRGWAYYEPVKEATAAIMCLENNMTTLTDVLADQGQDFEEFCHKVKKERETFKRIVGEDLQYGKTALANVNADNQPPQDAARQMLNREILGEFSDVAD
jgi:lambda family phage portal protein